MPSVSDISKDPVQHILFMDGECLFCQRSVKILHHLDGKKQLHFSTLQGEAAAILPGDWRRVEDQQGKATGNLALVENLDTEHEKRWRGADAVLRSMLLIGGIWKAAWAFHYLPALIKDSGYQLIARNRHRFSGGKKACELPDQDFSSRFLP